MIKLINLIKVNPLCIEKLSLENIIKLIEYLNTKYYQKFKSVVSDEIYDQLKDQLKKLDPNHSLLNQIDAPVLSKNKVILPYHMGSMTKIKAQFSDKILTNWMKQFPGPYLLSDKLDGISGLCCYNLDSTVELYTRGKDGKVGTDISNLSYYLIKNNKIPSGNFSEKVVVRGEFIMSKQNYKGTKHPRNVIGGVILSKKPKLDILKLMDFVIYELIEPKMSIDKQFKYLEKLNFNVVYNQLITELSFKKLTDLLNQRKQKSNYIIDGIIVSDNSKYHERNTSGNPKYSFAFKNTDENIGKETVIEKIVWNVSKDNYLKPTIFVKPIEIDGVIISKVTGHNAKYIVDNKLGTGAIIEIIRSGDVIPYISKVIKHATKPNLPNSSTYKWNKSKVDIINLINNKQQQVKTIYYFFKILSIAFLGEKTVEALLEKYNDLFEILNAKIDELVLIDGFEKLKSEKIVRSINDGLKEVSILKLMVASNVFGRGVAEKKIKLILEMYPEIEKRLLFSKKLSKNELNEWKEKIVKLNGFQENTTQQFIEPINDYIEFQIKLQNSTKINIVPIKRVNKTNNMYKNEVIVFSGFRDDELKESIESNGGKVATSVTKKTTKLYTKLNKDGEITESSKIKKAKELNIEIVIIS